MNEADPAKASVADDTGVTVADGPTETSPSPGVAVDVRLLAAPGDVASTGVVGELPIRGTEDSPADGSAETPLELIEEAAAPGVIDRSAEESVDSGDVPLAEDDADGVPGSGPAV